ncbi:MAG TPA: nucleotidyltransferase family protein [Gemmatimonadales bacterium]|nr:nucleotidyltransferase family protein [Gemmatimonadales bacterium]
MPVAKLASILALLFRSGSVGLVWPRLTTRREELGALALAMESAYRTQVDHNRDAELKVSEAVRRLRRVGIEPVLVKGWAISRLYPEPIVRSAGDIDLWVSAGDLAAAEAALSQDGDPLGASVDLQYRKPHMPWSWLDATQDALASANEIIDIGGVAVRTPRQDDHLRMVCLHFLSHGARRPLWLCDAALLMETRGSEWEWERVFGPNRTERQWIATTLLLAHELLGADISGTPVAAQAGTLPKWLIPAVLRRWESAEGDHQDIINRLARNPAGARNILRSLWPDPITATVRVHAPFNGFPRWPIQVAALAQRVGQFAIWWMPGRIAGFVRRVVTRLAAGQPQA